MITFKTTKTKVTSTSIGLDGTICGSCHKCCVGQDVFLTPREVFHQRFRSYYDPDKKQHIIPRNEKDECIYLFNGTCMVHHDPPRVCRTYDCRIPEILLPQKLVELILDPDLIRIGQEKREEFPITYDEAAEYTLEALENENSNDQD